MVRHTLKFLQQLLQDFLSVTDRSEALHIKGLMLKHEKCPNNAFIEVGFSRKINI